MRKTWSIAWLACGGAVFAALVSGQAKDAARVLDVGQYGAVAGDGKDDAKGINAAIRDAREGDTVRIGEGVWEIASRIDTRSNVKIVGAGREATTLKFIGAASTEMLRLSDVTHVVVERLTIDGNNSPNAAQGIVADNASKLELRDLNVRNMGATSGFGPHGVYLAEKVTESVISGCWFESIGTESEWGAGIRIAHESSRNVIVENKIDKTGRGGILANDGSTDLIIQRNTVTGSGTSGAGKGEGLGIELWGGAHRSVVEDNRIDHWLSVDSSNQVAVRRNVISDTGGRNKWAGLELVNAQDDVFTDNTVDRGAQMGISISGPGAKQRVYWGHNTIRRASTWGAQVQGETGKASQMYFYKNAFMGTARSATGGSYGPQGHGFRFNGDAQNIVLDSNTIMANQGAGIQLTGSNLAGLVFQNNAIGNNSLDAVVGDATGMVWIGNSVRGNGGNSSLPAPAAQSKPSGASVKCSGKAVVGQPLTFWLEPVEGVGEIVAVLWDADEGIPVTTPTIKHIYASPGKYRVTAVGWDASGRGVLGEITVEVEP